MTGLNVIEPVKSLPRRHEIDALCLKCGCLRGSRNAVEMGIGKKPIFRRLPHLWIWLNGINNAT